MNKHDKQKSEIYEQMLKLSPAQRHGIDAMLRGESTDSPEDFVRQMNYGGEYKGRVLTTQT